MAIGGAIKVVSMLCHATGYACRIINNNTLMKYNNNEFFAL
jgi:hypothetical protein